MRGGRWLRFVILTVLVGIFVSVAANLLLPMILNSRLLFGVLVVLLLLCGVVTAVISAREMFRR